MSYLLIFYLLVPVVECVKIYLLRLLRHALIQRLWKFAYFLVVHPPPLLMPVPVSLIFGLHDLFCVLRLSCVPVARLILLIELCHCIPRGLS